MIGKPPTPPKTDALDPAIQDYFVKLNEWLFNVYNKLIFIDLGNVKLTSSASAASGGEDGDIHVRVNGASTALYLNINGVWSAYTNP